ncbi:MAG: phosphatidylglycerophosphatase A [Acidobacteriota bacterium]|nr:phosphatidylglycerophosphatase A [Acidobacteriota bacterium]
MPASPTDSPKQHTKKGSARPTRPYWAWTVATFFGAGAMKPGPGTWGSAGALVTWWFIAHHLPQPWLIPGALLYCALATAIGIPASTLTARACHRDDPSHVVIDEVAGQMLTLVAAPITWKAQLAGFILFRAFDILKPWPIRLLERLRPEGVGIVVDDLGAGLYGFLLLQLLLHFAVVR